MLEKIFKAYDVRAIYPDMLDEDLAWKIGFATARFLTDDGRRDGAGPIVVSRDMRPSSESLCAALAEGLRCAGCDVIDLGLCDTSFIYFAVNHLGAIGGIQTTASHNPIEYNGFKISGREARPIGADTGLKDIQKIAIQLPEDHARGRLEVRGGLKQMDLWEAYRAHVLQFYSAPRKPTKVFVDASNGMAGVLVPRVFDGLENLEIIPLNFEIGKGFAHEPNPLVAENMLPTQQGVRQHGAHLGACFDGDADRCMFTDEKGNILGCDHLTALLTEHFARQHGPPAIAYDLRSSKVVEETIRSHDGRPVRSRVGHVFMKAALREHGAVFGGELSGHFYYRDNYNADSGAITFALVVSLLGAQDRPMSELIAPYLKYPQSGELNFEVEDKEGVLTTLRQRYSGEAGIDDLDGITVDAWEKGDASGGAAGGGGASGGGGGWWFNVRPSNTEPLLRFNAEARDEATLKKLLEEIQPLLGEPVAGH